MNEWTLLLIAHGSRSSDWNRAIVDFCADIRRVQKENLMFLEITGCFLEHASPSISEAILTICRRGTKRITAVPLFLSVGQHVIEDIPLEIAKVAVPIDTRSDPSVFQREDCVVYLSPPISTAELLADNLERRFRRCAGNGTGTSLVTVFYGSKRYPSVWNELAQAVKGRLTSRLAGITLESVYGGDGADFSPRPLAETLARLARDSSNIVILPVLISTGVIQTEIIPHAIRLAGVTDRVLYPGDAMLPDSELAGTVYRYAVDRVLMLEERKYHVGE